MKTITQTAFHAGKKLYLSQCCSASMSIAISYFTDTYYLTCQFFFPNIFCSKHIFSFSIQRPSFQGLLIRGARDGEVVKGLAYGQDLQRPRLPTVWLVFTPRYRRPVWVAAGEFVVGSLLCSERFFSGYSDFPLS